MRSLSPHRKKLIENDLALLYYYLPLDAHRESGDNWKRLMVGTLRNFHLFCEYKKVSIGVIGEMKLVPFDDFKRQIERYYGRKADAYGLNT